jgi:hypothetical protein
MVLNEVQLLIHHQDFITILQKTNNVKAQRESWSLQDIYKKPDPQRTFLHFTPSIRKDHVVHQILGAGSGNS